MKLSLRFSAPIILSLACLAATAAVACGGGTTPGEAVTGDEQNLTEESKVIVLTVVNTLTEDQLDLEVGLGEDVARKIVQFRPFQKVKDLRELVKDRNVEKILSYGYTRGIGRDGGAPGASGTPELIGLGCKEIMREERASLEIDWMPPEPLDFVAHRDGKQFYEKVPFVAKVTPTGLTAEASYQDDRGHHEAKLVVDIGTKLGTFRLDRDEFKIKCYYGESSIWEIGR